MQCNVGYIKAVFDKISSLCWGFDREVRSTISLCRGFRYKALKSTMMHHNLLVSRIGRGMHL